MTDVREADVQAALINRISTKYAGRRHLLVPEVEIEWAVPARIDALLVADRICGFEIKSDVDSLRRLPQQVELYEPVLERATLVVGKRHLDAAMNLIPDWWGVWLARKNDRFTTITSIRAGRLNREVNLGAVASLLPRPIIMAALRETVDTRGFSKLSALELRSALVDCCTKTQLLEIAREAMISRPEWQFRADHGWRGLEPATAVESRNSRQLIAI